MDRAMVNMSRFARPAALFAAVLVMAATVTCARRAYALATVPNMTRASYTLANGANSPDFFVPLSNSSVQISGTCNTFPNEGAGTVSAVFTPSSNGLTWTGNNAPNAPSGATDPDTSGFTYSTSGGVRIVYIGYGGTVWIETGLAGATSHVPNVVHIHNGAGGTRSVSIQFIY